MHYPFETLPAPGQTLEITAGLRWLRMPLPFALDHVNLWLIADQQDEACRSTAACSTGWAAVDTGMYSPELQDHWRAVLAEHRLTRQIVTHCHPDHLGLAGWLEEETGARLWISQGEYLLGQLLRQGIAPFDYPNMISFFARHGIDQARMQGLATRGNAFERGVPSMPASHVRLHDNEILRISQHEWQVIMGYGHAPEHAALYCADLQILISGDMLLPRITTNVHVHAVAPENDALKEYLDSIERFRPLPADTLVLPSHGRPFRGLHERLDQLQQHHQERCNALLAAAQTPKSAAELLPALFERDISDPHQLQFAMGETIAHLNYLENQQRLLREDDGQILRYRAL